MMPPPLRRQETQNWPVAGRIDYREMWEGDTEKFDSWLGSLSRDQFYDFYMWVLEEGDEDSLIIMYEEDEEDDDDPLLGEPVCAAA